jgi:hypothetical protein
MLYMAKLSAAAILVAAVAGTGVWTNRASGEEKQTPPAVKEEEKAQPSKAKETAVIAWGKEVDGLRVGISPAALDLTPDQKELTFDVWVQNVSKEPREVIQYNTDPGLGTGIWLLDVDLFMPMLFGTKKRDWRLELGAISEYGNFGHLRPSVTKTTKLGADETMQSTLKFSLAPRSKINTSEAKVWPAMLPEPTAGAPLKLRASVRLSKEATSLESGEAVYRLIEPAVKDGLSALLKADKAVFGTDDKPSFTATFKNVSDKPLLLYDHEWFYRWHYTLKKAGDEGEWILQLLIAEKDNHYMPTITLKPGETSIVKIGTGDHCSIYYTPPKGKIVDKKALDPGQYTISATIKLHASGENKKFWTGEITTNESAFSVGEEKKAEPAKAGVKEGAKKSPREILDAAKVTFEFDQTPVAQAAEFMSKLTGVSIKVEAKSAAMVTFKVDNMPASLALKWIARMCGMEVEYQENGVVMK